MPGKHWRYHDASETHPNVVAGGAHYSGPFPSLLNSLDCTGQYGCLIISIFRAPVERALSYMFWNYFSAKASDGAAARFARSQTSILSDEKLKHWIVHELKAFLFMDHGKDHFQV